MQSIVVDSGPLIALFDRSDQFHEQAVAFIKRTKHGLHTNLPVITEVVHLLDFSQQAQLDFLFWAHQALHIDSLTTTDWPKILALLKKYSDLPADFADASLIALCQRLDTRLVASVDSDFTIYRTASRAAFVNLFFKK